MKRLTTMLLLPTLAIAGGQAVFAYRDAKGDVTLQAGSGRFEQGADGVQKFFAKSNVDLRSRLQNIRMQAQAIAVAVIQNKAGKSELKSAHASGGVTIAKTGTSGQSTVESSGADATMSGDVADVVLTGPTRLRSSGGKGGSVYATGSGGTARLDTRAKGGSGLKGAMLGGPVRVEATQSGGGKLIATGSRLTADDGMRALTLSGNVKVDGSKSGAFGSLQNVSKVTLHLNEKGEVQSIQVNS